VVSQGDKIRLYSIPIGKEKGDPLISGPRFPGVTRRACLGQHESMVRYADLTRKVLDKEGFLPGSRPMAVVNGNCGQIERELLLQRL